MKTVGVFFSTALILLSCFGIRYGIEAQQFTIDLSQLLTEVRKEAYEKPTRTLSCLYKYLPKLCDQANVFEEDHITCKNKSIELKNIANNAANQSIASLIAKASDITTFSERCANISADDPIENLECFTAANLHYGRKLFKISSIAIDLQKDIRNSYLQIDADNKRCIRSAENTYLENSAFIRKNLKNCLSGIVEDKNNTNYNSTSNIGKRILKIRDIVVDRLRATRSFKNEEDVQADENENVKVERDVKDDEHIVDIEDIDLTTIQSAQNGEDVEQDDNESSEKYKNTENDELVLKLKDIVVKRLKAAKNGKDVQADKNENAEEDHDTEDDEQTGQDFQTTESSQLDKKVHTDQIVQESNDDDDSDDDDDDDDNDDIDDNENNDNNDNNKNNGGKKNDTDDTKQNNPETPAANENKQVENVSKQSARRRRVKHKYAVWSGDKVPIVLLSKLQRAAKENPSKSESAEIEGESVGTTSTTTTSTTTTRGILI